MRTALALTLATPLALAACATGDFERPGTWQPAGVNDRNLRAMLADPAHAARGAAAGEERGTAGSAPVRSLLRGARPPLPPRGGDPASAPAAPAAPAAPTGAPYAR